MSSIKTECLICGHKASGKKLSDHIRTLHGLSSRDYTIKCLYDGKSPQCPICGVEPRYVAFSFKKYCIEHSSYAEKEGGAKGGSAEAWNKGLTKETDERVAKLSSAMSGSSNPFYGREHTLVTREKISMTKMLDSKTLEERINERCGEFELVTSLESYKSRQGQYLEFKCLECGTVQPKTLQAFERGSRCYVCHPMSKSNWELEVLEYVRRSFPEAVSGDRRILDSKEIDVYVPTKRVGVECHGLYWHSEASGKDIDRNKHLAKLQLASSKDVKLFQLYYDEWRDKREICESLIDHRLGVSKNRIGARKLVVGKMVVSEQKEFFEKSHISGYVPSSVSFCLRDAEGRVIAALGLRTPRQGGKYEGLLEISRYATLPGWSVTGGLGKLMKSAKECVSTYGKKGLMTYVDRRIGDGHGYLSQGFKTVGSTGVDYWYTDNILRYDRFKFRAQDGVSEVEVAKKAGVSRIWGCGSLVMEWHVARAL